MSESRFDINELFFSITDKKGNIVIGNDVFIRVSEFSRDELIGKPHNIVRHSDTPKLIFKYLWEHITNSKPIVAYVKNRSKNGNFYWVLASVFPLKNRYLSIRLKPSHKNFELIKELYESLNSLDIEEGEKYLQEILEKLGYESYDSFMIDTLLAEFKSREKLLTNFQTDIKVNNFECEIDLKEAINSSELLNSSLNFNFSKIDNMIYLKELFVKLSTSLQFLSRDIIFLSLNTSINSYKMSNSPNSLSILSNQIRISSKNNQNRVLEIDNIIHSIIKLLNITIFNIALMKLQIEMITFFLKELIEQNSKDDNIKFNLFKESFEALIEILEQFMICSSHSMDSFNEPLAKSNSILIDIKREIELLKYINIYGRIESQKDDELEFIVIFDNLKALVLESEKEIDELFNLILQFKNDKNFICLHLKDAKEYIENLKNILLKGK